MEGADAAAAKQLGIVEGNHGLMLPPPDRMPKSGRAVNPRPKALVLDEDEWTSQLEAIIERDFFPDVPKLQSKLEWLQVTGLAHVCLTTCFGIVGLTMAILCMSCLLSFDCP
jgi:hypothetical protein